MVSRRRFLAGSAAAASTVFGVPTIVVAAGRRERVPVAVGSEHALVYEAWDVAKALGFFESEGLDVQLTYTKGGTEAGLALLSRNVDYSGNAIDHAIAAAEQGKSLVMISDFMDQPGITIIAKPENKPKYANAAALKGKTIGITSVGSATDVLAHWIGKRNGLTKDQIHTVGVGGGATVMAAIQSGQVDVALANDPFATLLIRQGRALPIAELYTPKATEAWLGFSNYTFTGALTRADVIEKYPERTQKIANALVRAQKFMAARTPQALAEKLSDEYRGGASATDWAVAYAHSKPAYTVYGRTTLAGVLNNIAANEFFLGKKSTVDPRKLFDNRFVDRANAAIRV